MAEKKRIAVLTGAGISAESGLRTFREMDGLWENHRVEDVASPAGWRANPQMVLDFYNARRHDVIKARPNAAHIGLAELQDDFDVTIVTQNIDDLHERGGSTKIIHLHGEILKMRSVADESQTYPIISDIQSGDLAPDGTQLRPFIVWFGESVPMIEIAAQVMMEADIFVCVGTSLQVYPAAGLIDYVPDDARKFIIDKSIPPTSGYSRITRIEKPATEGVRELKRLLAEL